MKSFFESPLGQLFLARLKEFYREPAAVFWVYGFPLLMALALGLAFEERPIERSTVDLITDGVSANVIAELESKLKADPRLVVRQTDELEGRKKLRAGKTDLLIKPIPDSESKYELWEEPNRPESILARNAIQLRLMQTDLKIKDTLFKERQLSETGMRYIDFLIPGLIGMNIMGGGLWGVGFVIVEIRVRKLLKRLLATPMKRRDFLLSIMLSRMVFTIPEVLILLCFGMWFFHVPIVGSALNVLLVILIGSTAFAGIGLLVASRAKTQETVAGLMNLVMLPMFVLSGVFFSAEKFPDFMQPFVQSLPLTLLNDAMRGVMLEGHDLFQIGRELIGLLLWGSITFFLALKIFRWKV
jgi:ABC-2 type transport system permease protein